MDQHPTDRTPTTRTTTTPPPIAGTSAQETRDGQLGEEVKEMARSRRAREKRAWDEMSETDRQVLLDTVRLRRELQASRDARELQLYAMRSQR